MTEHSNKSITRNGFSNEYAQWGLGRPYSVFDTRLGLILCQASDCTVFRWFVRLTIGSSSGASLVQ